MHYINVVISSTNSRVGKIVKIFTHSIYNHSAITLDEEFNQLYSFARKNFYAPLYGGFIKEKPIYYSLGKINIDIPVKVFKIPIKDDNFNKLKLNLEQMEKDDEYIYNLFSAVFYPIGLSFPTHKAYYCSEFVVMILKKYTKITLQKKEYRYSPKDISNSLDNYLWYEGNLSDLVEIEKVEDKYFEKMPLKEIINKTWIVFKELIKRKNK